MKRVMGPIDLVVAALLALCAAPQEAYAYVDVSAGSYAIQVLFASTFVAWIALKAGYESFRNNLRKLGQ